jgi:phage/plasmid-associated DNA primase
MYMYDISTKLYIRRDKVDFRTYIADLFNHILYLRLSQLTDDLKLCTCEADQKDVKKKISQCQKSIDKVGKPRFIAELSGPAIQRITDRSIENHFQSKLNQNYHLFALQGGMVIDTQKTVVAPDGSRRIEVRPRTREDYCTFEAPEPYDPEADGSEFLEFLMRIMARDTDKVECILRLLAYSMSGLTGDHLSPLCLGETRAGKSVFNLIVELIWGEYYVVADQDVFIKANRSAGSASYYLSELNGKYFAGFSEVDPDSEWSVANYKRLIGGDKNKSRKLYGENETVKPTHKLWIFCNDLPKGKMDDAMLARILKIDFPSKFPSEDQDLEWGVTPNGIDVYRRIPDYEKSYEGEDGKKLRSGALNVILGAMLRRLDANGDFAIPESFKASKRELTRLQNNIPAWVEAQIQFLHFEEQQKLPEFAREKQIKSSQLYVIYSYWCGHTDGAGQSVSKEVFYRIFPKFVRMNRNIDHYYINDKKGSRYYNLKITYDNDDEYLRQAIDRA